MEKKIPPELKITKRVKQLIEEKKTPTVNDLLLAFHEMTDFNTFLLEMMMELADFGGRLQLNNEQTNTRLKALGAQVSTLKTQSVTSSLIADILTNQLIQKGFLTREEVQENVNAVLLELKKKNEEKLEKVVQSTEGP